MLFHGQHKPGHHTGRTGCGSRHDQAHGSVYLQHSHGVGDGLLQQIAANAAAACTVKLQLFGLAANQPAHGFYRALQRLAGRILHDLPCARHALIHGFRRGFAQLAFALTHNARNRKAAFGAQVQKLFGRFEFQFHDKFLLTAARPLHR